MIIQPLYMRTGEIVNPPDEYIPRTREAVEFLIREDMITAVCETWRYPGMPPASNYDNYDHLTSSHISVLEPFVNRTSYVNSNMPDISIHNSAREDNETIGMDYDNPQHGLANVRSNGILTGEYDLNPLTYHPICFYGGVDNSNPNGKINHKRSYTGYGVGAPTYIGPIFTPTQIVSLETIYGIQANYIKQTYPVEVLIDKATGVGGGIRFIGNNGVNPGITPGIDRISNEYWFGKDTKYNANPNLTGNNDQIGYAVVLKEVPVELAGDPNPNIIPHYKITFDCASTIKVTHPNLHTFVPYSSDPNQAPTHWYYKSYTRLEPSGIVAVKSIGVPTTSIILGSKDGTGHGKYLEEFNMEYGGVGPDCFNANCIRVKDIVFEKYYPTSYFYRNGSYLNGVDGQTMGSLYKGCISLESVPAMNFDLIDYDGFFYNCNKLKSIGSNGLSGLYQNAMSMDGFLYGLSAYDSQITISAPKLSSFANNNNCTKLPKIIINQSNFRSRANSAQPWTVVFEMSGLRDMTLDSICETLEAIYSYEVVVSGGRLDKLQFKFGNNSLMSANSPRLTAISNLISSVGGNAVVYNI